MNKKINKILLFSCGLIFALPVIAGINQSRETTPSENFLAVVEKLNGKDKKKKVKSAAKIKEDMIWELRKAAAHQVSVENGRVLGYDIDDLYEVGNPSEKVLELVDLDVQNGNTEPSAITVETFLKEEGHLQEN